MVPLIERRSYDLDGHLTHLDRVRREGAGFTGLLVNDLTYDARGKVRTAQTWSAVAEISTQTAKISYAGLGAVVSSEKWVPNSVRWEAEQFRTTAMGEVVRSRTDVGSQTSHFPVVSAFDVNGALQRKTPVLPVPDPTYTDTTYATYDLAGNAIRSGAVYQNQAALADRYYTATRTYYAADNRLLMERELVTFIPKNAVGALGRCESGRSPKATALGYLGDVRSSRASRVRRLG